MDSLKSVRAEPVEALSFLVGAQKEGQPPAASLRTGFDKLRANGGLQHHG